MGGDDLKKRLEAKSTSLAKAKRAVDAARKANASDDAEAGPLFEKAIGGLREASADDLIEILEERREDMKKRADDALGRRREELHQSAKNAGWPTLRMQNSDRVGCFRVEYRGRRVTVKLGDERCAALNETRGRRVFDRLREERAQLESFPFSRDDFFAMVKDAVGFGRVLGIDDDGKVSIRGVYSLCVLVRQSRSDAFMRNPGEKNFGNYSICQFVYDMARFGRSGWRDARGERLASQTPNMATIAAGKALTLPSLEDAEAGRQIATLWIEKT